MQIKLILCHLLALCSVNLAFCSSLLCGSSYRYCYVVRCGVSFGRSDKPGSVLLSPTLQFFYKYSKYRDTNADIRSQEKSDTKKKLIIFYFIDKR